jgi:hypothetical protein
MLPEKCIKDFLSFYHAPASMPDIRTAGGYPVLQRHSFYWSRLFNLLITEVLQ